MVYRVPLWDLRMIETILWDFDGVILDSMKIKGDGFVELLKKYDSDKIRELESYHYSHGGVSRFEKIRYFFEEILSYKISEEKVGELAKKFGKIIEKNMYNRENLIEETIVFLKKNYTKYDFHIVSGAEHVELNFLCEYFDLAKYFLSINGSPTKKDCLVESVLEKYSYDRGKTILIGDSFTDYAAAKNNGIGFHGFNNENLKKYGNYIESFGGRAI